MTSSTFTFAVVTLFTVAGCPTEYRILDLPKGDTTLEDCTELCAAAIDAGCTRIECDIDAAADVTLSADMVVFHLDGGSDGGGGCELVAECPAASPCVLAYAECLAAAGDLELCAEQYELCEREAGCAVTLGECNTAAEEQRDWCNASTPDADCELDYLTAVADCQCIFDDCLTDETLDCAPVAAALISPPIQTGPTAWTVSRGFLDHQVGRLAALWVETRVWPVPAADDQSWRGLRLGSIAPGDALFAVGLRTGDVIRTVEGVRVLDAIESPRLPALRDAPQVRIGVERAGVVRKHTYQLVD
jgi:hypothetical protein